VRKLPAPPKLERWEPEWPPDRKRLVQHENGCLREPDRYWVAYCPDCWLSMSPAYFPHHTAKECLEVRQEIVEKVHES
jgi:hypothetical protein